MRVDDDTFMLIIYLVILQYYNIIIVALRQSRYERDRGINAVEKVIDTVDEFLNAERTNFFMSSAAVRSSCMINADDDALPQNFIVGTIICNLITAVYEQNNIISYHIRRARIRSA